MFDVVTFGETMLRLAAPPFRRLEQTSTLEVTVGGSEHNVATGVCRLGLSAAWVSRLPDNPLGRMVRNKTREFGVDTSFVVWAQGERLGLYFVEYGASPRSSSVLYDRAGSAISRIQPGEGARIEAKGANAEGDPSGSSGPSTGEAGRFLVQVVDDRCARRSRDVGIVPKCGESEHCIHRGHRRRERTRRAKRTVGVALAENPTGRPVGCDATIGDRQRSAGKRRDRLHGR